MKEKVDVDRLVAAARSTHRRGGHSPVYEALWNAYEALLPEISPPRMPNWSAMAEALAADGIRNAKGAPPTGTLVRHTWWKVVKDRNTPPAPRKPRGKASAKALVAPDVPQKSPQRQPGEGRSQFSFARPKGT